MIVLQFFSVAAGLAAFAGFYRLLNGPARTDRVIGLDLLFAVAIVFCLIAAWASGRTVYLDVAIGLALTGIVATLSWARLIQVGTADRHGREGTS
jgi:multicomponent Na+:H+ antiporter subunit F